MIDFRPMVFAQANQHHLVQTRFNRSHKPSVRLDSPCNDDMFRFPGVTVEVNRKLLRRLGDDDGLGRGGLGRL